jgi:hypothetical protein
MRLTVANGEISHLEYFKPRSVPLNQELYKAERSAASDQQVGAFGKAIGLPVIRPER